MKNKVMIVGVAIEVERLHVGRTKVFPGVWKIVTTAIRRTSKNHYQVYVILEDHAYHIDKDSIGAAIAYLQETYDMYGKIPGAVDIKGKNDEERKKDVT